MVLECDCAGELSRLGEVVPLFWLVTYFVNYRLGGVFVFFFGSSVQGHGQKNNGGKKAKQHEKATTHPLLQMPLVKSKHTPAVLGRGGIWPLGGSSCEKRQLSPLLHCPLVKSKQMSISLSCRCPPNFFAFMAAAANDASFLAFSFAFASFIPCGTQPEETDREERYVER